MMLALFRRIDQMTRVVVTALGVLLIVVVSAEIVFRYAFDSSLIFADELARYLFIWVSFLGASLALIRGQHVGLDLDILTRFRWIKTLGYLCTAGFLVILLWTSAAILPSMWDQHTTTLGVRLFWAYLAIPVGAALMLVQVAALLGGYAGHIVEPSGPN